jgi:8-oxo-dGTP pyrophosphatase MutT (NUDIX family)
LRPVFGAVPYPSSAFYIFVNVTLVDKKRRVLLTLSEDRAKKPIQFWTPPGGEVEVRKGQTLREAAIAEVYEEVGLALDPRKLSLIGEPQFIYPTEKYNPYNGVGLIIMSYLYQGEWNPVFRLNAVPEVGCMIVDYRLVPLPNSIDAIDDWGSTADLGINVYPNYAEKLLQVSKIVREGLLY